MQTRIGADVITVDLPLAFVEGLLAFIRHVDNPVRAALEAHCPPSTEQQLKTSPRTVCLKASGNCSSNQSMAAEILGQIVRGATLPDLFGRCVDLVHDLDPEVIERLSREKTHARRYVARKPDAIHVRSPHLGTRKTASGWWISANVSEQQVRKAMRLLARAAGLSFGKDLIFPLPADKPRAEAC